MTKKFLTVLDVRPHGDYEGGRSRWYLANPLVFQSKIAGLTLTVPEGFVTDFASVPRLPIVYLTMNDIGHPAAVVHDYLYRNGVFDRRLCDKIFEEALKDLGVSLVVRKLMWAAVRVGGFVSYQDRKV